MLAIMSSALLALQEFNASQGLVLDDSAQQLVNDVLVWIGFGTVVGLLAKGIMPGRDPGGAIATVLMGVGGTILGCGVASYFRHGERVVPISPMGCWWVSPGHCSFCSSTKCSVAIILWKASMSRGRIGAGVGTGDDGDSTPQRMKIDHQRNSHSSLMSVSRRPWSARGRNTSHAPSKLGG